MTDAANGPAAGAALSERFYDKVMPEPNSGCWLWVGSERKGYGRLYCRENGRQKPYSAHRLSYELHKGAIPRGMIICHRCDNTYCVNPDHLYCGTHEQNTADMFARGRAARQIPAPVISKIKNSQRGLAALAREYGLHRTTVWKIQTGRRWGHV